MIDWLVAAWNDFWHIIWMGRLVYVVVLPPIVLIIAFFCYIGLLFKGK